MAKALSNTERKLRLEMIDMIAQGVKAHGATGYYQQAEIDYVTKQVERIAKFLCIKN